MSASDILLIVAAGGSVAACVLAGLACLTLRSVGSAVRDDIRAGHDEARATLARLCTLDGRVTSLGERQAHELGMLRREAGDGRAALEASVARTMTMFAQTQARGLDAAATHTRALTELTDRRVAALRDTLDAGLTELRKANDARLEEMRATVEEKLHGTLETRLGESFKLVSERLEEVHRGLGEMQTLATGVGDLKRVLTNVRSRGSWGEVQLGMLLQDCLTADQYVSNVHIPPESPELVEFAVRLPGRDDTHPVLLPIDAKFPHEDYDRLLAAEARAQPEEAEKAAQALERAVRSQAKAISDKYVHPPHSTDFAIMYLPTEGLFAEVMRRPGLTSDVQTRHRVMIAGPTTLTALLTSLQLGFRTLAIEKRSSEVWHVLSAAKAEFRKYGDVWDKLGRQLDTAKNTVEEARRRTRAVERRLRGVETAALPANEALLASCPDDDGGPDEEAPARDGGAVVALR